jgi:hypothetical protein
VITVSEITKKTVRVVKGVVNFSKPYVMKSNAVLSKLADKIADCIMKEAAEAKKEWESK